MTSVQFEQKSERRLYEQSEIDILKKLETEIHKHLSPYSKEILAPLLEKFTDICDKCQAEKDKHKEYYKENAQKYRDNVKAWKEKFPEKQKQYSDDYIKRNRTLKDSVTKKLQSNKSPTPPKKSDKKPDSGDER